MRTPDATFCPTRESRSINIQPPRRANHRSIHTPTALSVSLPHPLRLLHHVFSSIHHPSLLFPPFPHSSARLPLKIHLLVSPNSILTRSAGQSSRTSRSKRQRFDREQVLDDAWKLALSLSANPCSPAFPLPRRKCTNQRLGLVPEEKSIHHHFNFALTLSSPSDSLGRGAGGSR